MDSIRETLDEEVIFDHAQLGLLNGKPNQRVRSPVSRISLGDIPSQHGSRKFSNLLRTVALCAAYFALGLAMAVTGPTLPYLQQQVDQTIGTISFIFTARSVGILLGSVFGGFLLGLCNYYSLLFIITVLTAIGIGAMPWCRHLWILMVSSSLVGIGGGFLDAGANVVCLDLWGKDSGSYMQAMHLTFGLGSTIAPLLVQSFIANKEILGSSHRNPRSVMESFEESNGSNFVTTLNGTQNFTSSPKLDLLNVTLKQERENPYIKEVNGTLITSLINTTGSQPTTLYATTIRANLTTTVDNDVTTVKPPKKPKPPFTDGTSLDDPSKFNRPLLNVPLPEISEETIPATDTPGNRTTQLQSNLTTVPPFNGTRGTFPAVMLNATLTGSALQNNSQPTTNETIPVVTTSTVEVPTIPSSEAPNSTSPVNPTFPIGEYTKLPELNHTIGIKVPTTDGNQLKNQSVINIVESTKPNATDSPMETMKNTVHQVPNLGSSTRKPTEFVTSLSGIHSEISRLETMTSTVASSTKSITVSGKENVNAKDLKINSSVISSPNGQATSIPYQQLTTVAKVVSLTSTTITTGTLKPSITTVTTEPEQKLPDSSVSTKSFPQVTKPDEQIGETISTTEKPSYPVTHRNSKPHTYSNETDDPDSVTVTFEKYGVTRMHMLYTVIAIIVLHVAFCFLFFLCSSTSHTPVITTERIVGVNNLGSNRLLTGLFFFIFFVYVGAEIGYGQFLATFARNSQLKLSSSAANYVTAVFWGSFTISRFVSIFVVNIFNSTIMLLVNFGLCTSASIILSMAGQKTEVVLYIGSAIIGIGMASTFATGFYWAERRLGMANRIASSFSIATAFGEMIYPVIIGGLMDGNPMSLMYVQLVSNLLCVVIFLAAWFFPKTNRCYRSSNEYQLAKQIEDE